MQAVFIENQPAQYGVVTGKWGDPVVALCPRKGDAELIAATPELLAALDDLLQWEEAMGGWENPCWARARAARKAAKSFAPFAPSESSSCPAR